jgi:Aldehyde oxidase and xanthine dehydrogenase, a/b hammerhead domain
MDGDFEIDRLALTRYGVGQPAPRNEDPMLLRGNGRYTDDLNLPGQAYAVIVRSRYAHGVINAIGTTEAIGMPGVLGIYTRPDLDIDRIELRRRNHIPEAAMPHKRSTTGLRRYSASGRRQSRSATDSTPRARWARSPTIDAWRRWKRLSPTRRKRARGSSRG